MKEEIEKYLEIASFLRDPKNASDLTEDDFDTMLDQMDALWYALDDVEQEELERLLSELK